MLYPPLFSISVRTSSPRLSRGLVAGLLAHGVWLALVLGHTGVHLPVIPLVPSCKTFIFAEV